MESVTIECQDCGLGLEGVGPVGLGLRAVPCPECGGIVGEYNGTAEALRKKYQQYETAHNRCETVVDRIENLTSKQRELFEEPVSPYSSRPDPASSLDITPTERVDMLRDELQELLDILEQKRPSEQTQQ